MTKTEVRLYRSPRKDEFPNGVVVDNKPALGVLYPSFAHKSYEQRTAQGLTTRTREADTLPFPGPDGEMMVAPLKGTSLFDRENVFPAKFCWSFPIPKGTDIPASIVVRHTGRNERFQAEHFQIEPKAGIMRLDAYKGALDNFARSALVKFIDDSKGKQ